MSEPKPQPSLHQSAIVLLRRAKADYNPNFSPLVQLMQWSLEHHKDGQVRHLRRFQSQVLEEMLGWPPREVERWLLAPGDRGDGEALPQDALEGLNPQEGAQLLLSQLHDQLPLHNRLYPPPSPGPGRPPADT
jgi:hypothetical protein